MSTEPPKSAGALDWLPLYAIVAAFLVISVLLFSTARTYSPEPEATPLTVPNQDSIQLELPVAPAESEDAAVPEAEVSEGAAEDSEAGDAEEMVPEGEDSEG